MSKPRWCDAPVWARYLTKSADGSWHWWMFEPVLEAGQYQSNGGPVRDAIPLDGPNLEPSCEIRPTH